MKLFRDTDNNLPLLLQQNCQPLPYRLYSLYSLCAVSTIFCNISYLTVCVGKFMCRQGFHIAVGHTRNWNLRIFYDFKKLTHLSWQSRNKNSITTSQTQSKAQLNGFFRKLCLVLSCVSLALLQFLLLINFIHSYFSAFRNYWHWAYLVYNSREFTFSKNS